MIKVIFEDNHLLVVEKPVNILSQGDDTNDKDMVNLLKQYVKEKYNKPGNVYIGLVHRLDRPVGGIMVFAKTSKAASRLSDQVRTKTFKKTYRAVIHGDMNKKEDTLKDYLYKNKKTNMVSVVNKDHKEAKNAAIEYVKSKDILMEIAKKEKIELTDEDYENYLKELLEYTSYNSLEDFKNNIKENNQEKDMRETAYFEKILEFIPKVEYGLNNIKEEIEEYYFKKNNIKAV